VGAPSEFFCVGERSVNCYSGAEKPREGSREEEKNGDAAATFAQPCRFRKDQATRRDSVARCATF